MLSLISRRLAAGAASPASNIAPFTVFQSTGMLMARPVPLQYIPGSDAAPTIAREGYVSLVVIPRSPADPIAAESGEKPTSSFEKEKKIAIKLRAKQIGQFIAYKWANAGSNGGRYMSAPPGFTMTAYSGSTPVTFELKPIPTTAETGDEPMMQLTLTPKPTNASTDAASSSYGGAASTSPVTMGVSQGEIRSLQVLMESCLPHLYGWVPKNTLPRSTGTWSTNGTSGEKPKSPEDFFKQFSN